MEEKGKDDDDGVVFQQTENRVKKLTVSQKRNLRQVFSPAVKNKTQKLLEKALALRRKEAALVASSLSIDDENDFSDFKQGHRKHSKSTAQTKSTKQSKLSTRQTSVKSDDAKLELDSNTSEATPNGDTGCQTDACSRGKEAANEEGKMSVSGDVASKKSCHICGEQFSEASLSEHLQGCLKARFEHTKNGSKDETGPDEKVDCPVCGKELGLFGLRTRTEHINKCIDQAENASRRADEEEEEYRKLLEMARKSVMGCPMCGKRLQTDDSRMRHLKQCALASKMSVEQVRNLMAQQAEEYHKQLDAGVLPQDFRPPAKQTKLKVVRKPSKFVEDVQVAKALSASMLEFQSQDNSDRFVMPKKAAKPEVGKKSKQDKATSLLLSLNKEEADERISNQVAALIFNENPKDELSKTPSFKNKKKISTSDSLWSKTSIEMPSAVETQLQSSSTSSPPTLPLPSSSSSSSSRQYYVDALMPAVSVSTVVPGSKVRRCSQIPGRGKLFGSPAESPAIETTSITRNEEYSTDQPPSSLARGDNSSHPSPSPSPPPTQAQQQLQHSNVPHSQTVDILAQLAEENDEMQDDGDTCPAFFMDDTSTEHEEMDEFEIENNNNNNNNSNVNDDEMQNKKLCDGEESDTMGDSDDSFILSIIELDEFDLAEVHESANEKDESGTRLDDGIQQEEEDELDTPDDVASFKQKRPNRMKVDVNQASKVNADDFPPSHSDGGNCGGGDGERGKGSGDTLGRENRQPSTSGVEVECKQENGTVSGCHDSGDQERRGDNDHRNMLECLSASLLSLVDNPEHSDITIKVCEGGTVAAHKNILSVRCPVLLNMIIDDGARSVIDLKDYSKDTVLLLLQYVYGGKVEGCGNHKEEVLPLAEKLGLDPVLKMVDNVSHLSSRVAESNGKSNMEPGSSLNHVTGNNDDGGHESSVKTEPMARLDYVLNEVSNILTFNFKRDIGSNEENRAMDSGVIGDNSNASTGVRNVDKTFKRDIGSNEGNRAMDSGVIGGNSNASTGVRNVDKTSENSNESMELFDDDYELIECSWNDGKIDDNSNGNDKDSPVLEVASEKATGTDEVRRDKESGNFAEATKEGVECGNKSAVYVCQIVQDKDCDGDCGSAAAENMVDDVLDESRILKGKDCERDDGVVENACIISEEILMENTDCPTMTDIDAVNSNREESHVGSTHDTTNTDIHHTTNDNDTVNDDQRESYVGGTHEATNPGTRDMMSKTLPTESTSTLQDTVSNMDSESLRDCTTISPSTLQNTVSNMDSESLRGCTSTSPSTFQNTVSNMDSESLRDCTSTSPTSMELTANVTVTTNTTTTPIPTAKPLPRKKSKRVSKKHFTDVINSLKDKDVVNDEDFTSIVLKLEQMDKQYGQTDLNDSLYIPSVLHDKDCLESGDVEITEAFISAKTYKKRKRASIQPSTLTAKVQKKKPESIVDDKSLSHPSPVTSHNFSLTPDGIINSTLRSGFESSISQPSPITSINSSLTSEVSIRSTPNLTSNSGCHGNSSKGKETSVIIPSDADGPSMDNSGLLFDSDHDLFSSDEDTGPNNLSQQAVIANPSGTDKEYLFDLSKRSPRVAPSISKIPPNSISTVQNKKDCRARPILAVDRQCSSEKLVSNTQPSPVGTVSQSPKEGSSRPLPFTHGSSASKATGNPKISKVCSISKTQSSNKKKSPRKKINVVRGDIPTPMESFTDGMSSLLGKNQVSPLTLTSPSPKQRSTTPSPSNTSLSSTVNPAGPVRLAPSYYLVNNEPNQGPKLKTSPPALKRASPIPGKMKSSLLTATQTRTSVQTQKSASVVTKSIPAAPPRQMKPKIPLYPPASVYALSPHFSRVPSQGAKTSSAATHPQSKAHSSTGFSMVKDKASSSSAASRLQGKTQLDSGIVRGRAASVMSHLTPEQQLQQQRQQRVTPQSSNASCSMSSNKPLPTRDSYESKTSSTQKGTAINAQVTSQSSNASSSMSSPSKPSLPIRDSFESKTLFSQKGKAVSANSSRDQRVALTPSTVHPKARPVLQASSSAVSANSSRDQRVTLTPSTVPPKARPVLQASSSAVNANSSRDQRVTLPKARPGLQAFSSPPLSLKSPMMGTSFSSSPISSAIEVSHGYQYNSGRYSVSPISIKSTAMEHSPTLKKISKTKTVMGCSPNAKKSVIDSLSTTQASSSSSTLPSLRERLGLANNPFGPKPCDKSPQKPPEVNHSHRGNEDDSPYKRPGSPQQKLSQIQTSGAVQVRRVLSPTKVSRVKVAHDGSERGIAKKHNVKTFHTSTPPNAVPSSLHPGRAATKANDAMLSPFTPMAPYDDMNTPELKKAVCKVGVKPMGKKRMRELLKHIYTETHQYETDTDDGATPIKRPKGPNCQETSKKQLFSKSSETRSCQSGWKNMSGGLDGRGQQTVVKPSSAVSTAHVQVYNGNDDDDDDILGSQDSSFSDGPDLPEESILQVLPDDDDEDLPFTQLTQTRMEVLNERLMDFLRNTPEVYTKILMYESLELDVLKKQIADAGIRIGFPKLQDFLDERCITFSMKNMSNRNNRQKKKGNSPVKRRKAAPKDNKPSKTQCNAVHTLPFIL